tara:strand:- start:547 stop:1176 length:630 start_codon:yes stop_codon:yes gene_type:complete
MSYLGEQVNNVKANKGLYTPSEILQLTKEGSWGGSLELIQEQTLSGAVSYNFTSIQEARYDVHLLQISGLTVPSGSQKWGIRLYEGGVLETASVYQYAYQQNGVTGGVSETRSTSDNNIELNDTGSEQWVANMYLYFYNLGNSSKYSFCTFQGMPRRNTSGGSYNDAGTYHRFGGGLLPQASVVDGIQIYNSATTSTGGTAKLFGVKQI